MILETVLDHRKLLEPLRVAGLSSNTSFSVSDPRQHAQQVAFDERGMARFCLVPLNVTPEDVFSCPVVFFREKLEE